MKDHSIICKFTAKIHAHSIPKQNQGTITLFIELRYISEGSIVSPQCFYDPQLQTVCCYIARCSVKDSTCA